MFGGDSDICEKAPGMRIFIMSNMHSVFVRGSKRFKLLFLSLNCACAAFFYYEVDGSSICLQYDMIAHVGGKRTHERYLVLRQRIKVCFCGIDLDHIYSSECYAKTLTIFSSLSFIFSFPGISLAVWRIQLRTGGERINNSD